MDDSSVDHHSGESKIAILMFALLAVVVLLGTIGAYSYSGSLMVEEELSRGEALIWVGQEYISMVMFVTLALLLFSGYPVAFILGGLAMLFGLLGYFLDSFTLIEYFNFIPRIWGQACENLVLVAVPAFVFMGVMMERSGIANVLAVLRSSTTKTSAGRVGIGSNCYGYNFGSHDWDYWSVSDNDDSLGSSNDDAAGIQPCYVMWSHSGLRYARNIDTAKHHAYYHGRSNGYISRKCFHGSCYAGSNTSSFLSNLRRNNIGCETKFSPASSGAPFKCSKR